MNDSQLLEDYVVGRDLAAFRFLVERHGPRVLRACRSVLRDPHRVEDAFQSTFLVLVRRAPSIRDPERLGNWLIGVANRVARRARDADERHRRRREVGDVETVAVPAPTGGVEPDLRQILAEELDRLPEAYRALRLCYLQGLTQEEAASRLGWPVGTLKSRLVRSRRLLRDRLDRRGVALGILLLLLLPRGARARPPAALVDATVDAMRRAAAEAVAPAPCRPGESGSARGREGPGPGCHLRWAVPALLALALVAAQASRLVAEARAVDADEVAALPANLTDVLNVRCR